MNLFGKKPNKNARTMTVRAMRYSMLYNTLSRL